MAVIFDLALCIKIILLVVLFVIIFRTIHWYFGYDFRFAVTYEDSEEDQALADDYNTIIMKVEELMTMVIWEMDENDPDMIAMRNEMAKERKEALMIEIPQLISELDKKMGL